MIIGSFILGGVSSAFLVYILAKVLYFGDGAGFVWVCTSVIVAFICGCSAWIVKTIQKNEA